MASKNDKPIYPRVGEWELVDGIVTFTVGGNTISFPVSDASGVVMAVIDARKAGYEVARTARKSEQNARKAERAAKSAAKAKNAKKSAKTKAANLRKQLAKLDAIAAA